MISRASFGPHASGGLQKPALTARPRRQPRRAAGVRMGAVVPGILLALVALTAWLESRDTRTHGPPWPNEPAGYRLVSETSFDRLTSLGWDIAWNDRGYGSIVTDATSPQPGNVLEMRYPAGFAGSVGPASEWRRVPSLRRIFIGFWWKASRPWQGHSSNVNKILFAFPSDGFGDIYLAMYGAPGGPYELRVIPQFPGIPSEWLVPNVMQVPVALGTWHRVEWLMEYNTTTTPANGVVKWWMDGKLLGAYHNAEFPKAPMTEIKINPTWGGSGDIKRQSDYYRYDDMRISGN